MKLYKGKKRLAMRMMSAHHRKLIEWALSIKPGDYIATCEGCNRKVAEIDFISWQNEGWFRRMRPNKTEFIAEVSFKDIRGRLHHCPGGGCAYPAETKEQVTAYFKNWAFDPSTVEGITNWYSKPEDVTKAMNSLQKFRDAFTLGLPIVDDNGELLPQFET